MNDTHSREYVAYLQAPAWRRKRREALEAAGYRCQRCGCSGHDGPSVVLEVHHLTYERLGHERPSDLKVVCKPCHKSEDDERGRRSRQHAASRLYEARLDGWASKVYGEDWAYEQDPDEVAEHFDRWVEDREAD